jgi:phosphopantothenoylcysteine decarboxylase/phosphopantothenate--cysteine ligase
MSAAVADYKPEKVSDIKIKKDKAAPALPLVQTTDILAELGKSKRPGQILLGFALETHDEISNAASKLKNKNLDFIVLNSLNDKGAGFGTGTNKISILDSKGELTQYELKAKSEVARDIINYVRSRVLPGK